MRLKHRPVQHMHVEFLPMPVELPHQQVHAAMQRLRARLGLPWGNKWREVWPGVCAWVWLVQVGRCRGRSGEGGTEI